MSTQVLKSFPDNRDYPVSAAVDISGATLPKDFAVWQPPVIEHQGTTGNCVAQVISLIMECIEYQRTGEHREYSVGYIYGKAMNPFATGMYPRDACNIALKHGDVHRSLWECFLENPDCADRRYFVPEYVQSQAKRISKFVRLYTKEETQAFIFKYGLPIMFTAHTYAYEGGSGDGLHAVAVYGWESEETFYKTHPASEPYRDMLYTNSWGTGGAVNDGRGNVSIHEFEEMWGLVPMEMKKLTDIDGHWAQKDIQDGVELGLFTGYEDGSFQPDKNLTRAEIAAITMRIVRRQDAIDKKLTECIEYLEKVLGIRR